MAGLFCSGARSWAMPDSVPTDQGRCSAALRGQQQPWRDGVVHQAANHPESAPCNYTDSWGGCCCPSASGGEPRQRSTMLKMAFFFQLQGVCGGAGGAWLLRVGAAGLTGLPSFAGGRCHEADAREEECWKGHPGSRSTQGRIQKRGELRRRAMCADCEFMV